MNPAHLHLMLNHFSIVGTIFGFALLVVAAIRNSRELIVLSFAVVLAVAGLTLPVYFTGTAAEPTVNHLPGISAAVIDEHEEAAQFGFTAIECAGVLALAGLWLFRREPVPRWFLAILLLSSLLGVVAMYYTAEKGRRIRHSEISGGYLVVPLARASTSEEVAAIAS